jgi:hypothetical protein
MSLSLEQLTQILAKVRISSSLEEEILTAAESLITPPEANEESTFQESCTSDREQLLEQEIEEDKEELQHDLKEGNHAYESLIEQWFQVSIRLDQSFCFYLVNSQLQQLNFLIFVCSRFHFAKLTVNIFLLLLRVWLHWIFDYT